MSTIPPLNYFKEKEAACIATRSFSLTLQEAFKEYKRVWQMYLDLVKKNESNNSASLSSDKSQASGQKNRSCKCSNRTYLEEHDVTNSIESVEDIFHCCLDFRSSMEESTKGNTSERARKNVESESPIFRRSNSISRDGSFKRNTFVNSPSKNIITNNNSIDDNEQENSNRVNSTSSTSFISNGSPTILCSTPIKNKKWSRSKKPSGKKSVRSKKTSPLNNLKKRNNLVNIRKEKTIKKVPLQIVNNVGSLQKNGQKNSNQIDKRNSTKINAMPHNVELTMSPSSKKLKQTKLVFHKTKKTTELPNQLKSSDASPTKTSSIPKILKQSTPSNDIGPKEKETNNKHVQNSDDQGETNEVTTENNFFRIYTRAQVKNKSVLQQEYENIDETETNDSSNTNNELDSTFISEVTCGTNFSESHDASCGSNESYALVKSESECKTVDPLETKEYIVEIIGTEEPTEKRMKLSDLENESSRCRNKRGSTPTSRWTFMIPESLSPTT